MLRSLWRVWRAYWFVRDAHRGQVDKGGQPYIRHLVRVAWVAYGLTGDLEAAVVGLLHDYVEDVCSAGVAKHFAHRVQNLFGYWTYMDVVLLMRMRFDPSINTDDEYQAYIRGIGTQGSRRAQAVKIADLLHNTDGSREWPGQTEEQRMERQSRYLAALAYLQIMRSKMPEVVR